MKRFKIMDTALEQFQDEYKGMNNGINIGLENYPIATQGISINTRYIVSLESDDDERSVLSTLKKVAKQIAQWIKGMWKKFMDFAAKIKLYFTKGIDRTVSAFKRYRNANLLTKRYLDSLKKEVKEEKDKPAPSLTKAEALVEKAAQLTKVDPPEIKSVNEAATFIESLEAKEVNVESLRKLTFTIEEGDYLLFHPDKRDTPLSKDLLKRHREINNEYLRYVLFCKDNLNPDKFVEAVEDVGMNQKKLTAKELARKLVDNLIEPFLTYTHMAKVDENLTPDYRLNSKYLANNAKRDILKQATKPVAGLSKYVGGYLENLIDADKAQQPKYQENISIPLNDVRQYLDEIKSVQSAINLNRAHLFDQDNHRLTEGFFLTTEGVEKMMVDMKLPKGADRRAIGQTLIEVSKECDSLINKAHSHWLRLANIQMEYLTKLTLAIEKLNPNV